MLTTAQRAAVVAEAKTWLKTPYRGWSCVKGVGTDCGQLIYGVFHNLGYVPVLDLPKDYSLQIAQHRASTEYLDTVAQFFQEIPEASVLPGDLVLYQIGLAYAHAAIVVSWPGYLIQAELRHGVSGTHGFDPNMRKQRYIQGSVMRFATLQDKYCQGVK